MIILTGGAGFIGSCFLWKLNSVGIKDVLVVDHLNETEKWKNLVGKKYYDYMQKEDFFNAVVCRQVPKPEAIIHLGACSSTTLTDANYYIKNNYEYSKVLALWAFELGIPFIYASSAATYGDGAFGYDDDISKLNNLVPLNMYGFSKHMFDMWLLNNNYINKTAGIKFFNVFGPNEYHKGDMRSVVCKNYDDVASKGIIKLFKSYKKEYADGDQRRDFVYVKDVVEAMYFLLTNPSKTGIFNLGAGKSRTWNDIAKSMFAAAGKKEKIEYVEMPEFLKPKYQYFTEAKMDNLKNAGYAKPFTELEDSVKDYCGYLKNKSYL
ncbi:ADP-glyceromanno-heptose 6-epimerase [Endomicrobium proavitum]|uniref:ADP-L-glycero-D-manno-heptose-6-epimerase n=1 Tax=Endomicrobium proavitum TaxID=1408281 RepID=A0A0G3WJ26_9BACT|nr:ADP-glyceromanno-heptose 6-epimerase [Endomicrobium proavitum]AKL97454.1 ADP-L-glycero-D-manno-heptose-6-epimerase, NAD(P)-binding [Endomicrobium proavitum]